MAKKKIYAVRKGHKTGLFETWAECQKATSGYSGAEFRGFTDREEAMAFLQMSTTANVSEDKDKEAAGIVEVPENMVIAYVDGSFEKSIGRYAFGCVILTPDGEEFRKSGSGCDPEGVKIRNVAGEMLGAMNAVQWAKEHGYPAVELRYDYEGVEKLGDRCVAGQDTAYQQVCGTYAGSSRADKISSAKSQRIRGIIITKKRISLRKVHCFARTKM